MLLLVSKNKIKKLYAQLKNIVCTQFVITFGVPSTIMHGTLCMAHYAIFKRVYRQQTENILYKNIEM